MKTYEFEIIELLSKIIEINANDGDEAYRKVKEMYQNEEIILDNSDYIETEINRYKYE